MFWIPTLCRYMNTEITHRIIHIVVLVTTQLSNIKKCKMEIFYKGRSLFDFASYCMIDLENWICWPKFLNLCFTFSAQCFKLKLVAVFELWVHVPCPLSNKRISMTFIIETYDYWFTGHEHEDWCQASRSSFTIHNTMTSNRWI